MTNITCKVIIVTKNNKRIGLGKLSAELLSKLAERNKRIFTLDDAKKQVDIARPALIKLISDLVRKNWLVRLTQGTFMLLPLEAGPEPRYTEHEFVIASHLIEPYYLSYWPALNYYGWTEQKSRTVFVATTKRKRNLKILGIDYTFVTLNKRKFFGFTPVGIDGNAVNIAEKEKAIVDCLDLPKYSGGIVEVAKSIWNGRDELDVAKMLGYASRIGNRAAVSRLCYLLDIFGIQSVEVNAGSYSLLDPLRKREGRYISRFSIIENIPRRELLGWREH